jgi:excisionase family DNA binding protein
MDSESNWTREPDELMTVSDAGRILGLSPDMVRRLADEGRLRLMRTVGGVRLFRRADVERLAEERRASPVRGKEKP